MHNVLSKGGLSVRPIVGFVGEVRPEEMAFNREEVAAVFTLPLRHLLREDTLVYHKIAVPRENYPRTSTLNRVPN
jgi:hypothetical protein